MVRKRQDIFGNICWYNDDGGEFHRDDRPSNEYASGRRNGAWIVFYILRKNIK